MSCAFLYSVSLHKGWVCLQCVAMALPGHIHLPFDYKQKEIMEGSGEKQADIESIWGGRGK